MHSLATTPPLMRTQLRNHTTYKLERYRNQVSSQLSTMTTLHPSILSRIPFQVNTIPHPRVPNLMPFQPNMIPQRSILNLILSLLNMLLRIRALNLMPFPVNMVLHPKVLNLMLFQLKNTIPVSQMISLMTTSPTTRPNFSISRRKSKLPSSNFRKPKSNFKRPKNELPTFRLHANARLSFGRRDSNSKKFKQSFRQLWRNFGRPRNVLLSISSITHNTLVHLSQPPLAEET